MNARWRVKLPWSHPVQVILHEKLAISSKGLCKTWRKRYWKFLDKIHQTNDFFERFIPTLDLWVTFVLLLYWLKSIMFIMYITGEKMHAMMLEFWACMILPLCWSDLNCKVQYYWNAFTRSRNSGLWHQQWSLTELKTSNPSFFFDQQDAEHAQAGPWRRNVIRDVLEGCPSHALGVALLSIVYSEPCPRPSARQDFTVRWLHNQPKPNGRHL